MDGAQQQQEEIDEQWFREETEVRQRLMDSFFEEYFA